MPITPKRGPYSTPIHTPARVTRLPGPTPGACVADSRSPRPRPLTPPTPLPVVGHCSSASLLLWPGLTSCPRTSAAMASRLPAADQIRIASLAGHETSRFPGRERAHMPGSPTTPGRPRTRARAPVRVAFRDQANIAYNHERQHQSLGYRPQIYQDLWICGRSVLPTSCVPPLLEPARKGSGTDQFSATLPAWVL